jgi:hypothetical protein
MLVPCKLSTRRHSEVAKPFAFHAFLYPCTVWEHCTQLVPLHLKSASSSHFDLLQSSLPPLTQSMTWHSMRLAGHEQNVNNGRIALKEGYKRVYLRAN